MRSQIGAVGLFYSLDGWRLENAARFEID